MTVKRALISGITGQDGSYLAEFLLEKGYEVHGIVRRSSTETFERIEHLTGQIHLHQADLLDQVAWTVIYSPSHLLEQPYRVMPGDTLDTIGNQYRVTGTLLGRINGIRPDEELAVDRELKVVRGPFNAVIHLDQARHVGDVTMVSSDHVHAWIRKAANELCRISGDDPNVNP